MDSSIYKVYMAEKKKTKKKKIHVQMYIIILKLKILYTLLNCT